jgi:hypothetical protein
MACNGTALLLLTLLVFSRPLFYSCSHADTGSKSVVFQTLCLFTAMGQRLGHQTVSDIQGAVRGRLKEKDTGFCELGIKGNPG